MEILAYSFLKRVELYLIGKAIVGVVHNGKYYDNSNPEGKETMPRYRLVSAWLVTK